MLPISFDAQNSQHNPQEHQLTSMCKFTGADDKACGLATLDHVKRWGAEGRVNPLTQVLSPEGGDWRTASDVPGPQETLVQLGAALSETAPGGLDLNAPIGTSEKGLATTSLLLGYTSTVPNIILAEACLSELSKTRPRIEGIAFEKN